MLPDLSKVREISLAIAKRVIEEARNQGLATYQNEHSVDEAIQQVIWQAKYYPYEKMA